MEYIYIIKSYGKNKEIFKLGYSNSIINRISSYSSTSPYNELLHLFELPNAYTIEQQIHNQFKADLKREWYFEDTILKIIQYLKNYNYFLYNVSIEKIQDFCKNKIKYSFVENINELNNENNIHINVLNNTKSKFLVSNTIEENITEYLKGDSNFALWMYNQYRWFEDAINLLGVEKIIELDYNATNIQRNVNKIKYFNDNDRIRAELKLHYKIKNGVFIPSSEMKSIFEEIHKRLDITKTPKGSDIMLYWYSKKLLGKLVQLQ
jgi:hypothetical protein